MKKLEDRLGFTGTISEIKDECGKRFCESYGITRKNAYKNVNCPINPVDLLYVGCIGGWPKYHFDKGAIGDRFQLREFIGGSKHVVAFNYSSGCLDPDNDLLFTVIEWND